MLGVNSEGNTNKGDKMNQREFNELEGVQELIEIQKRNPYKSEAHKKAYNDMRLLCIEITGQDHIGEY